MLHLDGPVPGDVVLRGLVLGSFPMNAKALILTGAAFLAGITAGCAGGYFLTIYVAARAIEADLEAQDFAGDEGQALPATGQESLGQDETSARFNTTPATGKRRIALPFEHLSTLAGFVLPGSRIDILHTEKIPGEVSAGKVVVENVSVLAVDPRAASPDDPAGDRAQVTVEVTPEQAEKLTKLADKGSFQLALR